MSTRTVASQAHGIISGDRESKMEIRVEKEASLHKSIIIGRISEKAYGWLRPSGSMTRRRWGEGLSLCYRQRVF